LDDNLVSLEEASLIADNTIFAYESPDSKKMKKWTMLDLESNKKVWEL